MNKYQRFLIIRTDRIGDVLLTLPMAEAIKRQFPQAYVAMLIRRYTSELVEDNRFVDRILYYDEKEGELVPMGKMATFLRDEHFDVVFHTQPRPRLAFITRLAGIPVRVGTGYRWYSFLFNKKVFEHRKDAKHHELEYNLNLLRPIGCSVGNEKIEPVLEVGKETEQEVQTLMNRLGIQQDDTLIILHPGSGGSARDWSAKNFGLLAQRLSQASMGKVIVTGTKKEERLVNEVCSAGGENTIPVIDRLNLRQFAALAKQASVFVANSTGPIHIAAAVGTPVIGLYPQITAQSPVRWGPYTEKKIIFTPKNKPVDCTLCENAITNCSCMDTISVEDVYQAIRMNLKSDM